MRGHLLGTRSQLLIAALISALISALTACSSDSAPHPIEPFDDLGPEANNRDDTVRRPMAACPNGGNVTPTPPYFNARIDDYASYVGQTTCDPTAKPGVKAFRDLVLATYPCTTDGGITRDCQIGGTSEHKEGRAWDWMVSYPHPAADALLNWLLATDSYGNKHAFVRRFGIMYMIWNKQMWRAYDPGKGWQPYSGENPHTDHVHFSFSWDGANKKTSYWNPPKPPPADSSRKDLSAGIDGGNELFADGPASPASEGPTPNLGPATGGCSLADAGAIPRPLLLLVGLSLGALFLPRRVSRRQRQQPRL